MIFPPSPPWILLSGLSASISDHDFAFFASPGRVFTLCSARLSPPFVSLSFLLFLPRSVAALSSDEKPV